MGKLRPKIEGILRLRQHGHPITYTHSFTDIIQYRKARETTPRKSNQKAFNHFSVKLSRSLGYSLGQKVSILESFSRPKILRQIVTWNALLLEKQHAAWRLTTK